MSKPLAEAGQFHTLSGLPVAPLYTAGDLPATPPDPGVFPYRRGIHPEMYRKRL
jgi:methylmalonyl-CoA mutase N-terminal domain/subunit